METIWIWGPIIAGLFFAVGFFCGTLFTALTLDKHQIEEEARREMKEAGK